MKGKPLLLAGVSALGVASAVESRLSVFAALGLVIGYAAGTRFEHPQKRWFRLGLAVASACTLVGMGRFITGEALPGIVEARGRESEGRAVSMLREILFAEDALRRYAWFDHDGDGVGSAGYLGELAGEPTRLGATLETPPLAPRLSPRVATNQGPALEHDGYLFLVCLPGAEGNSWSARPSAPVDEERAERHWLGYAWPSSEQSPHFQAFFIDEHEHILVSKNAAPGGRRLVGETRAPACRDALDQPESWKPWRDKQPRRFLPGDRE